MTNATGSRLGVVNGVAPTNFAEENALFQTLFAGEVMTAFDETNVMLDKHRVRQISGGKAASFPAIGKATARYHVPGTPVLGSNQFKANERIINADDLLISDVVIYDIDEAKNHYDVRAPYSKQLGASLAKAFDEKVARVAVLAARSAGLIADLPGGAVIKNASMATDGDVLAAAFFSAAQSLDEKDVPEDGRYGFLRPAQYHLLAQTTKVLNKDWGGSGAYAEGSVIKIAGIDLVKSNHIPSTNITSRAAGENNDYTGDFTNTVGFIMNEQAVGTVRLMDIAVQQSGQDFNVMYQGTLLVAKMAVGHGILRPDCAVELSKAAP